MEDIKIKNVSMNSVEDAIDCVKHFSTTYPYRMGINNGCAYSKKDHQAFYVYRLRTTLVVVGQ